MRKSRAFRRIVILFMLAVVVASQTVIFAHSWFANYNLGLNKVFFLKGYIVLFGLYAIMFAVFCNVYGAFKLGSLQYSNLVFSQILAIMFTNALIYLQTSLLSYKLVNVVPFIGMSFLNLLVCLIWCALALLVYRWLYPPRELLLIYSDRDPDNLVKKIETREDKYLIKEAIHCDTSNENLRAAIRRHNAVLLCDVPSGRRNKIVKYCYMHDKRKPSDETYDDHKQCDRET